MTTDDVDEVSPPPDPPDAGDVAAAVRHALTLVQRYMIEGGGGTLEDRIRLHAALKDGGTNYGILNMNRIELAQWIAADLEEEDGRIVVDGRVWRRKNRKIQRKPDPTTARLLINQVCRAPKIDPDTGEMTAPTAEEMIDRLWTLVEPALGRTRQFANVGIDVDELYEEVSFRDDLEEP